MNRQHTLALLAACATLVALAWVLAGSADLGANRPDPATETLAPSKAEEIGADQRPTPDEGIAADRTEAPLKSNEPLAPSGYQEIGFLRGRVISEALNEPLEGALINISRRQHFEFRLPDPRERNSSRPVAQAITDELGYFEVVIPIAIPFDIEAIADHHATARRDFIFAGEEVLLKLPAAALLEGVIQRALDDSPVAHALVIGMNHKRMEIFRSHTNLDGQFISENLEPGLVTVEVTPQDAIAPPSQKVDLQAGLRTYLEFTVENGFRIHGMVIDQQGLPIAGAEVGLGASLERSTLTDINGWYEMIGVGDAKRRGLEHLVARAEGYGKERKVIAKIKLEKDMRLDFALTPARIATGRVVDPEGSPLEGVYVAGVGSKTTDGIARSDWESTLTDHEGLFKLSELHQQVDHQLFLQKDQYGTRVYDFPADEKDENQIDYGDLILHPGGRIEGILRSQAGAPIPGHQVKLRGTNQDLGRFRPGAQPLANTWVTAVRESRTDSQGRFFFQDLPGGEFRVTAAVQGRPGVNDEETVQLIEGGHVAGIALELNLGKPIKGIVLTPEGLPAIGVFVQVANAENRIKAPTGSNGNFELFGVTDEMETVDLFTVVASYNWHNPTRKLAASELVQARPGDTDIVIKLREIVTLTGRIETDEGQPIPNVEVRAYLHGTPRIPGAVLAKDTSNKLGLFRLDLPEQCFVDLVADAPQPKGAEPTLPSTQKPVTLEIIPSTSQNVTLRFSQ